MGEKVSGGVRKKGDAGPERKTSQCPQPVLKRAHNDKKGKSNGVEGKERQAGAREGGDDRFGNPALGFVDG